MNTSAVEQSANSINDAMRRIGCGRTFLYAEMNRGHLKARKIGKRTVILEDDLRAYLAALPSYDAKMVA